ncbi:hypothetical protein [Caldanaerobius polysaccharolyticus]|uniref:hypothetical protein n=1 Tax=Caldanaerobius polysaccharolyticus TaxID=44256 RepID=UPI0004796E99|nr:hypothetical protein [Caldanaerobius polysaccharolyticus]
MQLKGLISSIEGNKARVTFPDKDNSVAYLLPIASHVIDLEVGNRVAVIFFSNNMADGVIIAKF